MYICITACTIAFTDIISGFLILSEILELMQRAVVDWCCSMVVLTRELYAAVTVLPSSGKIRPFKPFFRKKKANFSGLWLPNYL